MRIVKLGVELLSYAGKNLLSAGTKAAKHSEIKILPMRKVTEKINFKDIKHPFEPLKNLRKKIEIPKLYFAAGAGAPPPSGDNNFTKIFTPEELAKIKKLCKGNNLFNIFSKVKI